MVIRKVVEPDPSRCATTPIAAVPNVTAMIFPRVALISARITGVNRPTSCNMPKKMMAKINITTTLMTELKPSLKKSDISPRPNPHTRAPTTGTNVMGMMGFTRPRIKIPTVTKMTKRPTVVRPSGVCIVLLYKLTSRRAARDTDRRGVTQIKPWPPAALPLPQKNSHHFELNCL